MQGIFTVSNSKVEEIKAFMNDDRHYVAFKDLKGNRHNVYLLIHGTESGAIILNKKIYSLIQIARVMAKRIKELDNSVTHVYTISCYGGMQDSCLVDGIKFESSHTYIEPMIAELICDENKLIVTPKYGYDCV